ncbi:MAG: nucleoside deaminase [Armatimonadota bacterium]|nr:nucleoside deaminase [bacterium]
MMTDADFMRLAITKAYEGIEQGQTPFGACIARGGEVITCVHNSVWANTDITAHAEIAAIRDACVRLGTVDLQGCVIYSTCEPCPMCFSACHWAGISHIFYGAQIEDAQGVGFSELTVSNADLRRLGGSPVELTGGLLREECAEMMRYWQEQGKSPVY